jgi:hypothetical protein
MSNFVSVVDLQDLVGKDIDFFLENDFFEIEGIVKKENEQFILEILGRVPDNHKLAEKIYEIELKNNKVYLKTPDEQDFEIFINKIYETIDNPTKEQLIADGLGSQYFSCGHLKQQLQVHGRRTRH